MASPLLTTASSLQCPHGGSVSITSSNTSTKADSAALALVSDTFSISGCPFQIPIGTGTKPSPCIKVQWLVTNLRSQVNSTATLSSSSVGLCLSAEQLPQGPVSVVNTQAKASST